MSGNKSLVFKEKIFFVMGGAIFVLKNSLLEDGCQEIASWCTMRCTQVYWQDIRLLQEKCCLRFNARLE